MHVVYPGRCDTGTFQQVINILGDMQDIRSAGQRLMARIGPRRRKSFAPPCIPIHHPFGRICKTCLRSHLHRIMTTPQCMGFRIAECADAGFCAQSCARETNDVPIGCEPLSCGIQWGRHA